MLFRSENERKISTVNVWEFTVSLAEFKGLEPASHNLDIIMNLYTWIWLAEMVGRAHIAECSLSDLERLNFKQREPRPPEGCLLSVARVR